MIYVETKLEVGDNSGAKIVKCIKLIPHSNKAAKLGTRIVVSLEQLKPNPKNLEKKSLYNALIIGTAKKAKRADGSFIKFDSNSVLLLDRKKAFLGTRVRLPICREIRTKQGAIDYKRIISYAKSTL